MTNTLNITTDNSTRPRSFAVTRINLQLLSDEQREQLYSLQCELLEAERKADIADREYTRHTRIGYEAQRRYDKRLAAFNVANEVRARIYRWRLDNSVSDLLWLPAHEQWAHFERELPRRSQHDKSTG